VGRFPRKTTPPLGVFGFVPLAHAEQNILSALARDMRAERNPSRLEFWKVLAE